MTKPNTAVYFPAVAAAGKEIVLSAHLIVERDDPSGTLLLRFGPNGWGVIGKIADVVNDLRSVNGGEFVAVGREGMVIRGTSQRILKQESFKPRGYGYIEAIRIHDGQPFVCGADRQVALRNSAGRWDFIDDGIAMPSLKPSGQSLLCATIDSNGQIVVAGTSGFAAIRVRDHWSVVDIPTNMDLQCACTSWAGTVYLAGGGGTLLAIRADGSLEDLTPRSDFDTVTFHDLCEYQGRIYLASGFKLHCLEADNSLRVVTMPIGAIGNVYRLAAAESLWCVGDEILREYTGDAWRIHDCPANKKP